MLLLPQIRNLWERKLVIEAQGGAQGPVLQVFRIQAEVLMRMRT